MQECTDGTDAGSVAGAARNGVGAGGAAGGAMCEGAAAAGITVAPFPLAGATPLAF